jgi:thiol-disulfide isomerase/thioredoxin
MVLIFVAACSTASGSSPRRFIPTTGSLPQIQGTSLEGSPLSSEDYGGKVLLINFWNQDCPPCLEEMPVLESAWQDLRDNGLFVVGVVYVGGGWPDDPTKARRFLSTEGITYPTIVDEGSHWADAIGIVGIPTTIVVDRSGMMRFRLLGRVRPGDAADLLRRLTPTG